MAITATQEGRNLHIHVDGLDPFVIKPLPGGAGLQLTETYLETAVGRSDNLSTAKALAMAVDGAQLDSTTGLWEPSDERANRDRIEQLSLGEQEDVTMAALFWQTILNMAGVNIYLSEGGVGGHTKAMRALVQRLGLSPLLTSPSSALDALTQLQDSTRSMSTPQDGAKPGKKPLDRLRKKAR